MAINIGNIEVAKFYLGTEDDIKIYLEETLLYPQLPSFKFKAEYSGGVSYSAECDSSTTLATGDTKPSGYEYTAMTSSEVGQCITNIDVEAFRYCTSLSSVTLSDSVTTIGNSAFRGCRNLKTINIPSGVTSIGGQAFNQCYALTSIDLPSGLTAITTGMLQGCRSLSNVTIPNGVISISANAFDGCSGFTSIDIPNSVTSIGSQAFKDCGSLTTCTIGSGVTSISDSAFGNCSSLTAITINATTPPTLGNNVFSGTNDCSIYVPCESVNAYKSASGWSTYSSRIQCVGPTFDGKWKATYSDSHIESAQCDSSSAITQNEINLSNLVSVEIGDCVTSIGNQAFNHCTALTSIDIPNSVTSIGNSAFNYCSSLTSIDIPNTVTSIGELAFIGCTSLTSITIPDSVTSIGVMAFYSCSSLTSITVNATTPPTLEGFDLWFDDTNNCPIYVPSQSVEAYKSATNWSKYASRIQAILNS